MGSTYHREIQYLYNIMIYTYAICDFKQAPEMSLNTEGDGINSPQSKRRLACAYIVTWIHNASWYDIAWYDIQKCSNGGRNAPSPLQWRHNGRDGVSNHQFHDCLLNRLFRHRSKKTTKLIVTGLCEGNSPITGEFPAQRDSNAQLCCFHLMTSSSQVCHGAFAVRQWTALLRHHIWSRQHSVMVMYVYL